MASAQSADVKKNIKTLAFQLSFCYVPGMAIEFKYRSRVITDADVTFIRQLIEQNPTASRRRLSKLLCEAWNWVQPNGVLCDMVCRGLMLHMHRAGAIELPPVRQVNSNPLAVRTRPQPATVETTELCSSLGQIQPLVFVQVRRTKQEAIFNGLIEQYHYLGYTQPVGEHLKYLVYALGRPLAALAWSSSPRHLGPRDRFIGWSAQQRRQNIRFLAYNSRFLILPWVHVPYLASHILGRMAHMLPGACNRTGPSKRYDLRTSEASLQPLLQGVHGCSTQGSGDQ